MRDLFFRIKAIDQTAAAFAKVKANMKGVERAAASLSERINRVGKGLRNVGAVMTGASAGLAFAFRDSLMIWDEAAQAQAKVEQAIRSTGGAAGFTAEQLAGFAREFQNVTRFDGDDILGDVTAQLLTFTNVSGEAFRRAQEAVLNISTVMKTDLKSTAIQVGKALNDPIKGLAGLGRAGIQFSEDQKATIKTLVETGEVAKAQAMILDELAVQFGGQAEASAKAGLGFLDQFRNAWGDVQEGEAPAYRGIAYLVFEDLPLADYGNRIPQIAVEVFGGSGEVEDLIRGVDMIPGSTEWGYSPTPVKRLSYDSSGEIIAEATENSHRFPTVSDWSVSLDVLQGTLRNVETVALVVTWFGDDLRAGQCTIRPKVENQTKSTDPVWTAGGLTRATADLITQKDGRPVYGSTPADRSVIEAIRDLNSRGLRVVLYPFVMMDIPADNTLPDPDGTGAQPENPWRGRIRATAGEDVADEIAAFLGTTEASDFDVDGDSVSYAGPAEWSYRRFILHLAHLAQAAGGVDAFLIGSETVGLTQSTEAGSGVYPFVAGLVDLAADVSGVLPGALISYAADWSEYHSHRPADGSGDVFFNLDPLWSSPHVDFVAIDNYLPLSDWRPGTDHLDYDPESGHVSIYDLDYLKANVEGGEYFDWFYASEADRLAQDRTPIEDTAHGEHWVFRQKAIRDWFGNAHRHRPGGVRDASPTAWTANAKPPLVHRMRLPGGRSRDQSTQPVLGD
jgi:hypothetical protein